MIFDENFRECAENLNLYINFSDWRIDETYLPENNYITHEIPLLL